MFRLPNVIIVDFTNKHARAAPPRLNFGEKNTAEVSDKHWGLNNGIRFINSGKHCRSEERPL